MILSRSKTESNTEFNVNVANDIGNSAVQEAFSGRSFYRCHVAAVLTNRYFTFSAKELAENNEVLLWDRDRLNQLFEVLEH